MAEVALVVHYQAQPGKGDEVAFRDHQASPHFEDIAVARIRPLLADRRLEYCQVVQPQGTQAEAAG